MNSLVIYYSLEGNTKYISECIANAVNGDILELKPKKDISPNGFARYFWGGKQVLFKEKPELNNIDKNPLDYDFIFIGSPVWAATYAPVFNSFFKQVTIKNKKIALFACYGGNEGKIFNSFKNVLVDNEVVSEIGFKDPLTNDKQAAASKVTAWAQSIVGKSQK
ncbi:flavodoxin family protein [Clostridium oryzae]|uniref:Flavodoxin n=1 Tax=Clostridium oryzae TaxID=1450648 RepID=A0A1V4IPK7_9CLOT|nr:flavodoxin [Clostridium oryzae]OPJ61942.1 flavodoxin [Clostridium oryzae]